MHRTQTLALLLAAGLLCSGCASGAISSNYRPVEDLMLIQTIGVDRAPEGVCLSASTGRAGENKPPQRMTQTGETVLAALDRLQDRTPNAELFYAQTSYLLLGEEAAAAGELTPLLDFIARNPDMRLSAPLFLVRGAAAQQAVMDTGDDRTDVTEALTALQKDTALSGAGHAFSCADIARALAGSGCAAVGAVACVRTPESEGGKLALAPAGYAIFRGGDYLGCIAPETARGASMLLGVVNNGDIAVRVGGWVRDALSASQALEADFLGVGQAVAVRSGRRWAAIRDGWAELWPDVPVRVTVAADVGRTYDLRDGIDTTGGGR